MRILITGSSGFIGRHLSRELGVAGHLLWGADREPNPEAYGVPTTLVDLLVAGGIERAIEDAARAHGGLPHVVVHLAAKVGRLFGEDNLARTIEDNATMTSRIVHAIRDTGTRIVYASTSEVYGDRGELVCDESMPLDVIPHNLYGLTKRWGEDIVRLYAPEWQIVRLSMPYGPGLPSGYGRAAIVNMLAQAATPGCPIPVHRGAERSWCWVGDTVRALRLIVEQGEVGPSFHGHTQHAVYNVGRDDDSRPMLDVAKLACVTVTEGRDDAYQLRGAVNRIVEVDAPGRQTVVKRLATDRLRRLGWQPEVELDEGMRLTWRAMLAAGDVRYEERRPVTT